MKCIICGCETHVLSTRRHDPFTTLRVHRCMADETHTQKTFEVPERFFIRPPHFAKRFERLRRDTAIRLNKEGLSNPRLGQKYGLTEAAIRYIKGKRDGS